MTLTKRMIGVAIVAGLVSACAPQESTPAAADTTAADKAAIDQVRSAYQAAFTAGDGVKIGSLYTSDGVDMPANEPTREGSAAIVTATQATFAQMKPGSISATITPTDTHVMGDMAIDRGTYHFMMTPMAGGGMAMVDGRYVVVLHRQADKSWKVTLSMDNTPAPLAMPPAMPSKKEP